MIEIKVDKFYGKKLAFRGDFTIRERECIGLIGNNGAGKTTMLRLVLDLVKATSGKVKSQGKSVAKSDHWKAYTGSFLDAGFLIPFLSPMEYLSFVGSLHRINNEDLQVFLELNSGFFDHALFEEKNQIKNLSTGNQNKVGILATLLIKPKLLILDGPFANLDPTSQSWLKKKLRELNVEGMTMIISSHDLNHITEISTRTIILDHGKIVSDKLTNTSTLDELEDYFNVAENVT